MDWQNCCPPRSVQEAGSQRGAVEEESEEADDVLEEDEGEIQLLQSGLEQEKEGPPQ